MKTIKHKKVQQKPFTFQDWWDKHGFDVRHFKPCRKAWNDAYERRKNNPILDDEEGRN